MKTIVVATDLTSNSNKAAHFAARLARDQGASLILVNIYRFWPANPAEVVGDYPLSTEEMRDNHQRELDSLANSIRKEYGSGIVLEALTEEGYVIPTVQGIVAEKKADLLVMSPVGSAPDGAQIMGSVATDMVTQTTVPLLIVPPSQEYGPFKNAVVGIDLDSPPDAFVVDNLLRFAKRFGCVVNVISVHSQPDEPSIKKRAERIRHLLASVPHTFTVLKGEEVYETLLDFTVSTKADLMMMIPQEHGWLWSIFNEGESQRMARLTEIPLLIVVR
ncbi:universal stress protein [Salmonirosea aquatica]|uniref:Universal stress protein n=1 Tax=Salmonirosea aquatica TaxID=2654236 RepID=A0A7C9BF98_9BACT|nr:universal stress protein [Cytophagaceae bacterium SJW1-29]